MKKIFAVLIFLPCFIQAQNYRIFKGDTINRTDSRNLKQGVWKKYYSNDTLFSITFFKNDKPIGETQTYYKSGKPEAKIKYSSDGKHASVILLHEGGKKKATGFYYLQKKDSVWKYYNELDSLTAIETYKEGIKNGAWKVFYENGKIAEEFNYLNDKREGMGKQYFLDGIIKLEVTYKNDNYQGVTKMYHPNGKIWFSGHYSDGIRQGEWNYFNEAGTKDSSEFFKDGLKLEH